MSTVALSPDGAIVAFVVGAVDLPGNRYTGRIWLAPTDGSRPARPLTAGDGNDGAPAWSPDGRVLAFTSERGEAEARHSLHVVPTDGPGETVTLATAAEPFEAPCWSPDGRWLGYAQRARTDDESIADPKARPPRRITRFFSRLDAEGWTQDRPRHVWVVPADGSLAPRDLTPGPYELGEPAWLPDASALVCAGAAHEDWDLDLATHLHVVGLDGTRRALTEGPMVCAAPAPSPDGRRVAFVGHPDPFVEPSNALLGVVDVGTGAHRWLDTGLDRTWGPYPSAGRPRWLGDAHVLASVEDRGNVHLYRVPTDGGSIEPAVVGDRAVTSFDAAGGVVAAAVSLVDRPAEAMVLRDGIERQVSAATVSFCAVARPIAPERFTMHIDGKGSVGFAKGTATIELQEQPGPVTLMTYSSDVQIGGKIAGVGQRLLESVGKMMTRQALDSLNKELQARL